jgi:hypothetical protein
VGLSQELQGSGVRLPDGGWSGSEGVVPVQQQLRGGTGSLPGKPEGPDDACLAQKLQDIGVKVPSGGHVASGLKSLAWEHWKSGAGSLAGEWWETKKELLLGEEFGKGTEFLAEVQQEPDAGFLPAERWRMGEVMSVGFPYPAAGPVFKER